MIYTHIALLANQIVQLEKENRTLAENQAALLKQADDCAHMQEESLRQLCLAVQKAQTRRLSPQPPLRGQSVRCSVPLWRGLATCCVVSD